MIVHNLLLLLFLVASVNGQSGLRGLDRRLQKSGGLTSKNDANNNNVDTGMQSKQQRRCETLRLEYDTSELVEQSNAIGKTQHVRVNVPGSNEIPGLYLMSITDIWNDHDRTINQCTLIGSINLDYNGQGYNSQLNIQGSCLVDTNTIVGGTGKYKNAIGTQTFEQGTYNGTLAIILDYCSDN